jgi:hypothetical protein
VLLVGVVGAASLGVGVLMTLGNRPDGRIAAADPRDTQQTGQQAGKSQGTDGVTSRQVEQPPPPPSTGKDGPTPPTDKKPLPSAPETEKQPTKDDLVGVWEGHYQGLGDMKGLRNERLDWVQILELKADGNSRWQQEVRRPDEGGPVGSKQELAHGKWKYDSGELILENEWVAEDLLHRPLMPKLSRCRLHWEDKNHFVVPPASSGATPNNFPMEWTRVPAKWFR